MKKIDKLFLEIEELEKNNEKWLVIENPTMMLFKQYQSLLDEYSDIIPAGYSKPYKTFTLLIEKKKYNEIREELGRDLSNLKSVMKRTYP